ncbi:hypothetical protein [Flavobacterium sp. N3904]|uniref:hypothetical protein n=1 Tax=Flavobacterium sp. N3904 TaxID=2986835 RepID=UPI0022251AD4|nr:hypothetical protein [Flavobacterium sp. N3904]
MIEKLGYGYIDPATYIERNEEVEEIDEVDDDIETKITDVPLYDLSLTIEENFRDGIQIKYILLPIKANGVQYENNYSPLLNAGAKIVMNAEKFEENSEYLMDFIVIDYDTMFGLRLLSFQKYNSDLFSCDERVFFETLLIKFQRFGFIPFFISYTTIEKELGIKKNRAITISKKFKELGFLNTEIQTSKIDDRPSQVTYYHINASKIIELLPKIYIKEHLDVIGRDVEKYLAPAIAKIRLPDNYDISSIMQ